MPGNGGRVARQATCVVCDAPIEWRGVGRPAERCSACRAKRSGWITPEPATASRERARQLAEQAAITAWARQRAAEIRRRVRGRAA